MRKRKRRSGLKLIALMVMIICAVVLYKTKDLHKDVEKKETKIEQLKQKIDKENLRNQTLLEEKAYRTTKKYYEEIARTKLGLYYPDEIIVKPNN